MYARLPVWIRLHLAGLRALLVLTVVLGLLFPAAVTAVAHLPGLAHRAEGSAVHRNGTAVGSALVGQAFTDARGTPLPRYFQSRPSAAGAGYDATASGASNLGPEEIVDSLPGAGHPGRKGLLTLVCSRSRAVGQRERVDGRRPYCTAGGIGAVLSVVRAGGSTGPVRRVVSVNEACPARPFLATYQGVRVECARPGVDYRAGRIVPVRGPGRPWPRNPVPPDAVTASGSGLDPAISPAYARLQAPRVARVRGLPLRTVLDLVSTATSGRTLGVMGEPAVNVLALNLALDGLRR